MGELLFWQREKDSTSAAAEAGSRGKRATGTFSNTAPVRILSNVKKQPARMGELLFWQREKDSNPHIRSQSPLCYLYTIPLNARAIIPIILTLSSLFFLFFQKLFSESFDGAQATPWQSGGDVVK